MNERSDSSKKLLPEPKAIAAVFAFDKNISSIIDVVADKFGYNDFVTKLSQEDIIEVKDVKELLTEDRTSHGNRELTRKLLYSRVRQAVVSVEENFEKLLNIIRDIDRSMSFSNAIDKLQELCKNKIQSELDLNLQLDVSYTPPSSLPSSDKKENDQTHKKEICQTYRECQGELITSITAVGCDKLITSLYESHIIASAEMEVAQQALHIIIKIKCTLGAIGEMLNNTPVPQKRLKKVITVFRQVGVTIPLELKKLNTLESPSHSPPQEAASSTRCIEAPHLSTAIDCKSSFNGYANLLHSIYDGQEKPDIVRHRKVPKEFISPSMAFQNEKPVTFNDLITLNDGSRCILIGPPGIGKTWLVCELRDQWVNKNSQFRSRYPLFIFLKLDQKDIQKWLLATSPTEMKKATNDSPSRELEILDEIIFNRSQSGKGVYIILEGLDTMSHYKIDRPNAIIVRLLNGEILPKASILVTTRNFSAINDITRGTKSKLVQVKGFNNCSIKKLFNFFRSSLDKLPSKILSCLQFPIVLRIVTYYLTASKKNVIPNTNAALYEKYIETIVEESSVKNDFLLKKEVLYNLAKLALSGILQNKFTFDKQPETLNLMYLEDEETECYRFQHQTIQEFLAAYFISMFSVEKVQEAFDKYSDIPMLSGMLSFLAGLTGITSSQLIPFKLDSFHLLHQFHEAGKKDIRAADSEVTVKNVYPLPSPYDMLTLGYCIGKSHVTWKLDFKMRSLTANHIKMFCEGINQSTPPTGKIKELKFSLNNLGNEGAQQLLSICPTVLESVTEIQLRGNGLSNGFKFPSFLSDQLLEFHFHHNRFNINEQQHVIETIIKCPSLKHVTFSNLSPDECKLLLSNIKPADPSRLTVELRQLTSESIDAIMELLPNSNITKLYLHESVLTPEQDVLAKSKIELVNCTTTTEIHQKRDFSRLTLMKTEVSDIPKTEEMREQESSLKKQPRDTTLEDTVPTEQSRQLCTSKQDKEILTCSNKKGVSDSDEQPSRTLNMKDLIDVCEALKEGHFSSAKWHDLGLQLGLYCHSSLDPIEANYPKNVDRCLKECLGKWLQRADGVDEKGGPTWVALANALEKINFKAAAEYILLKKIKCEPFLH